MWRWHGEHRPTVRWISCRSKVFLFRLFLRRVLGTRWWRVSRPTVRPQSPHSPPLAPLVLFTDGFYRRFGARQVITFPWSPGLRRETRPARPAGPRPPPPPP